MNIYKFCFHYGILFAYSVQCHIRLTWPPARYPPLDFLDNIRTAAPCGVPKQRIDQGTRISLKAGSTINVTWSLGYPHQGGFRLEILDEQDHIKDVLTSEQLEYVGANDPTTQSFRVTLPNKPCRNCAIRLLRQAIEWGSYKFWSCADIDIELDPTERCSNHGRYVNKKCQCERNYNGDVCQYQDECLNDQDCGGNGKCIELDVFHYPRRLCYCRAGWFGTGCQQESKLKNTHFDASLYQYKSLQDDENKLYWRILKETSEIEFVMQYYGKSWVAVGWRPQNIDPQCTNLNNLAAKIFSKSFVEAPNNPEPPSSPKEEHIAPSSTEHITVSQPSITDGQATTTEEPDEYDVTDTSEPEAQENKTRPKDTTVTDSESLQNGFSVVPSLNVSGSKGNGIVVVTPSIPQETDDEEPAITNGTDSDAIGEVCYGDWRWPPDCRECDYRLSWTYVDEYDDIEFSLETRVPANWWTGVGFSKTGQMSDADIIVVKSLDSKIVVQDMHSTGYSVPVLDSKQDITLPNVVGTHLNGVLRAAFARSRHTTEDAQDVQFTDTDCFYFLFPVGGGRLDAKGQMAQHLTTPKVSAQKICVKSCGTDGATVPAAQQTTCQKEFKFPIGCQLPACDYYASWNYNPEKELVNFQISSRELGRWTGIGFSTSGNMTNSDIILGWVYDNSTFVTDRFAYGKHQPAIDRHQDIEDVHGKIDDDVQTIFFSRKLETEDVAEDLSLLDCLYYLFPVGGGRVLAKSSEDLRNVKTPIGFHDLYVPKISRTPICICTDDGYPLFALNETSALVRQKRLAPKTTTPEYDDGYDEETDPTPLRNSTRANPRTTSQKIATKVVVSQLPTIQPTVQAVPTTVQAVPTTVQAVPKTTGQPQSGNQGLSGEFSGGNVPQTKPAANEVVTTEKLHPMDCTDIIIGSAVGGFSKVEDYYTISRATPMVDEIYGGRQSITSAIGYEENDVTTIIFRRKLTAFDPADHTISDGVMSVIWAKGQYGTRISHNPKSGLEQSENKKPFYSPDVLSYHGSVNRGQFSVNFFEKAEPDPQAICRGEQVYPPGCSGAACQYNITWVKLAENINFIMDVKLNREQWTGVGFSKDGAMAKSDAILIQVNPSGPVEVTDRFLPGYTRPVVDRIQNIFNVDARYINGRVSATFTRTLVTDDSKEDIDLNECFYFLYPFKGGSSVNGEMQKHNDTPGRSEQICFITKCASRPPLLKKPFDNNVDAATVLPAYKKYLLILKVLNYEWIEDLLDSNSNAYKAHSAKIISAVDTSLSSKFKGYQKAEVTKLRPGSVIADVTVTAAGIKDKDILETIQTVAKAGLVQGLRIDPETVTVQEVRDRLSPEEIRNYVIIAIAIFLVIIAFVCGICLIVYIRKRKTKIMVKTSSKALVPFSPYSYMISNGKHPSAYQYPPPNAALPEKKAFDNRSYHLEYTPPNRANNYGLRQTHSTMTMSTPNDAASSIVRGYGDELKRDHHMHHSSQQNLRRPVSRAESTQGKQHQHQQKSGSASHYHHSSHYGSQASAQHDRRRRAHSLNRPDYANGTSASPYVQYPNDPNSFYTMNGVNRVHQHPRGTGGYFGQY